MDPERSRHDLMLPYERPYSVARGWKARTELGDVRARRPHAPEHDPDVLHDEYAVAVDDDGYLHTWRFRPLDARERPGKSELEIPGRA